MPEKQCKCFEPQIKKVILQNISKIERTVKSRQYSFFNTFAIFSKIPQLKKSFNWPEWLKQRSFFLKLNYKLYEAIKKYITY